MYKSTSYYNQGLGQLSIMCITILSRVLSKLYFIITFTIDKAYISCQSEVIIIILFV